MKLCVFIKWRAQRLFILLVMIIPPPGFLVQDQQRVGAALEPVFLAEASLAVEMQRTGLRLVTGSKLPWWKRGMCLPVFSRVYLSWSFRVFFVGKCRHS